MIQQLKLKLKLRFVYINMHVLTFFKSSWQQLIQHLSTHHFHHVSF